MPEHAVFVYFQFADGEFGTDEEREQIVEFCEQLETAINDAGVGEFDGEEFGNGHCQLYLYGEDADSLYKIVVEALRTSSLNQHGRIVRRYGDSVDARVVETPLPV